MKNQGIMCNKNLIEKDECGNWEVKGLPWEKLREGHVLTKEDREKLYGCLCKLKDYESTGLYPDQVERIQEKKEEGWIPCSERLPENNNVVLCWVVSKTIASGETFIIGSCDRGFWFLQTYEIGHHHFPVKDYEVVAWMHLPQPYQPKGE